ncbi:hypothetical protein PLANPX_2863 [Lacipirellula parvula]|uniref:Uncharacterized protein n=1 Tax=Lacipirellula parvula TaxID=2650471 RepID=A0A5K7XEF3_9BACT|nr:hypothetical protein PLANPX_2863 [Lacipirellula parvula]
MRRAHLAARLHHIAACVKIDRFVVVRRKPTAEYSSSGWRASALGAEALVCLGVIF